MQSIFYNHMEVKILIVITCLAIVLVKYLIDLATSDYNCLCVDRSESHATFGL